MSILLNRPPRPPFRHRFDQWLSDLMDGTVEIEFYLFRKPGQRLPRLSIGFRTYP